MGSEEYLHYNKIRNEIVPLTPIPTQETKSHRYYEDSDE